MEPDNMGRNLYHAAPKSLALLFRHLLWHSFFLFLAISDCFGQKDRFERITVDNGLSQSAISAITQDKYGYLWIATLDGLNRYDGREFKIYRHSNDDPKSLYSDHVSKLYIDSRQTLWVCHQGVIARYNPQYDNFDNFPFMIWMTFQIRWFYYRQTMELCSLT
jgi:ligand-binding sensor domain-containing protein